MADDGRCRMQLKRGGRCKNRAVKSSLCGVHRRAAEQKRSAVEMLLKTGQYAAAIHGLWNCCMTFNPPSSTSNGGARASLLPHLQEGEERDSQAGTRTYRPEQELFPAA